MTSKKEQLEKDLKAILAKDIGAKNPIFSPGHIAEIHAVFSLYADPRQRRTDIRDILLTCSTLGLDQKYQFVIRLLQEIHDQTSGNALDFEGFLKELTNRIGNPFSEEGRKAHFNLLDIERKGQLNITDLKHINEQLKYGYNEDQLWDIIHSVGGYNAETITYQKFNSFVKRTIQRRKIS